MPSADQLDRVFGALADGTRRDILARLRAGAITVGELAGGYSMSRPAISQHISVLENAGLITRTVSAQWRECSIREAGLDEAAEWIARNRKNWNESFDLLDAHIQKKREEQK